MKCLQQLYGDDLSPANDGDATNGEIDYGYYSDVATSFTLIQNYYE